MTILRKTILSIMMGLIFFTACEEDPLNPPENPPAKACFTVPSETGNVDDEISFTNCSENATLFSWDFGDGNKSTQKEPNHSYSEAGTFEVTLLAGNDKNKDGVLDEKDDAVSATKTLTVEYPVKACFSVSSESVHTGEEVLFTNCSINDSNFSFSWSFGDGNISTEHEPIHIYNEAGTYEVLLYIGGDLYSDSYRKTVTVTQQLKFEIGIKDATTWSIENPNLTLLAGATIDLYINSGSVSVDNPDYTGITDEHGHASFYDLPTGTYYSVVTKGDLSNIVNGLRITGVFQTQAEVDSAPIQPNNPSVGDLVFADMNQDGIVDSKDEIAYGVVPVMGGDMSEYSEIIIGK